jgi:hypothetical protein
MMPEDVACDAQLKHYCRTTMHTVAFISAATTDDLMISYNVRSVAKDELR